jgi:hypothetical protein
MFDSEKIEEAHLRNQNRSLDAVQQKLSPLIIDNTNTLLQHIKPYVIMGIENDYSIIIMEPDTQRMRDVVTLATKNNHHVPLEVIQHMSDEYEHIVTLDTILDS